MTIERRKQQEEILGRKLSRAEKRCLGKARHRTDGAAAKELERLQKYSKRYRAYLCKLCGYWHCGKAKLGSQSDDR